MCGCETRLAALESRVAGLENEVLVMEKQVDNVSTTAYEALGTAGAATFTAQTVLANAAAWATRSSGEVN